MRKNNISFLWSEIKIIKNNRAKTTEKTRETNKQAKEKAKKRKK